MLNRKSFHTIIASGLGSGYSPVAPGTFGSAAFVLLWILCGNLLIKFTVAEHLVVFIVVVAIGLWSTGQTLKSLTQDTTYKSDGKMDPQFVVIDEWAGLALSLIGTNYRNSLEVICAFVLFRIFDIIKPAPIRQLERLRGEWGVMLDDLAAGIYALIVLTFLRATYF